MAQEMKLPQLGENVDTGVVLNVLVSPGEEVREDQPILELETDKATTEVPADFTGTIEQLNVAEGQEIGGGDTILTYEISEEPEEKEPEESKEPEPEEPEEPGQEEREEPEEEQPEEREESQRRKSEPSKTRRQPTRRPVRREGRDEPSRGEAPTPRLDEPVPASPSVRQFARELGVDLDDVVGTDPGGRVSREDVKSHVRALLEQLEERGDEATPLPDFSQWGEVQRRPMSAIRRAVSRNVAESWEQVPHVSQFDNADITGLERFRERFSDDVAEEGGKLTVTAILLKVAAEALEQFPSFNASLDLENAELIQKDYVNIGVAVDTDDGLLVPVIRDAHRKGLVQLAVELTEVSQKARARKLSKEAMEGGTFTVTNLGGLGTTHFTPIIGWPQVAILAVGRATMKPVYQNEEFVPRRILPLGITYDHRAVDGADAARFLRWIAETLEEPLRLTMNGGK